MRKIVFLWMALFATMLNVWADDEVTFTTSAPDAVAVGDQFRLSYIVNTRNVKDFRAPSIQGFDVLMGPSRSTSVNIINGKLSWMQVGSGVLCQAFWIVLFGALGFGMWKKGLKRFAAVGG